MADMSFADGAVEERSQRAFTVKSLLFACLAILAITCLAGIQCNLVGTSSPLIGNYLPAGVFFYITLVVLFWNGLVGRLFPRLALNSKELAVVLAVSLVSSFPPNSGLFRYFHRLIMLPWYHLGIGGRPDWAALDIMSYLSERMFPTPVPRFAGGALEADQFVYNNFFLGMKTGDTVYGLAQIPWRAWLTPILFWGATVFLMSTAVIALCLIVHRQWARHEQLSYPIAQVAHAFIHRARGVGVPDLFRSGLFWWGFTAVFSLYAVEYLHQWFPENVPSLRVILPNFKHWRLDLYQSMPFLRKLPASWALCESVLCFSFAGMAYFVSSEISFSMGINQILFSIVGLWIISMRGAPITWHEVGIFSSGGYIGYALILLYAGRAYYWAVAKRAFFVGRPDEHGNEAAMAARIFVLSSAGFMAVMIGAGMDWTMALCFTLFLLLSFLVLTRLVCETGIPYIQPGWRLDFVITSLFGPATVGPKSLVLIRYLECMLARDQRETLMPYAATALRVADYAKLRLKRVFRLLVVATLAATAVGFVTSHWTLYNYGGMSADQYASVGVPANIFTRQVKNILELKDLGLLETSAGRCGLGKLALIRPWAGNLAPWLFGVVGVVIAAMLRFRFAKFPIHPVLFLVVGCFAGRISWYSFLVGWAVKVLVVRFGGGRVYQNLKPLIIGVIAAELMAVGFSIVIALLYYAWTGVPPPVSFTIVPG